MVVVEVVVVVEGGDATEEEVAAGVVKGVEVGGVETVRLEEEAQVGVGELTSSMWAGAVMERG